MRGNRDWIFIMLLMGRVAIGSHSQAQSVRGPAVCDYVYRYIKLMTPNSAIDQVLCDQHSEGIVQG